MLRFIVYKGQQYDINSDFNTSHVTVYRNYSVLQKRTVYISIHPMLRFICFCLLFWFCLLLISIHPMLRFIIISKDRKLFLKNLNTTPKQYISDLKFAKAKQMIKDSTYSISEIARICGFSSIHYFSRVFKEKYGITPTSYAKSIG